MAACDLLLNLLPLPAFSVLHGVAEKLLAVDGDDAVLLVCLVMVRLLWVHLTMMTRAPAVGQRMCLASIQVCEVR